MKTRTINKSDKTTMPYSSVLRIDLVKDICSKYFNNNYYLYLDLKKPTYVDGIRKPIDSDEPMLNEQSLSEVLNQISH